MKEKREDEWKNIQKIGYFEAKNYLLGKVIIRSRGKDEFELIKKIDDS